MLNLLYLCKYHNGGITSFTVHLTRALDKMGVEWRVLKVGKRTEDRFRNLAGGIEYQNVSINAVPTDEPCIVIHTAPDMKDTFDQLPHHIPVIVHDHNEMRRGYEESVAKHKVIVIRQSQADSFTQYGIEATYIPHPYVSFKTSPRERVHNAVTLCKIFPYKNLPTVMKANRELPPEKQVHYYGEEFRPAGHGFDQRYPEWRDNYHGKFDCAEAVNIAQSAKYVVDLTVLPQDGGGTQYTFLEAWDAGATLILHKQWFGLDNYCVKVETSEELCSVLNGEASHLPWDFAPHSPENVVPRYLKCV